MTNPNDRQVDHHSAASRATGWLSFAAGRRAKWLILLVWLVAVAAISPFAAKLSSVTQNDEAAWLPGNAESLKVSQLQSQFSDGETMPAVIVYHRDGGLTPADLTKIESDRAELTRRFPDAPLAPLTRSDDGQAALYAIQLSTTKDDNVTEAVKEIRRLVESGAGGMAVKLTGPAGFGVDLAGVFNGADTTLLLATAAVVAALLLLTYRSPFLWLVPIFSVAFAHQVAGGAVYGLAKHAGLVVNGQSQGILPVLVFGAGTDYALLLIARYREELRRHDDHHQAMAVALRRAGPAILASSATVAIGLLCLLVADLNPTRSLGPVGALGIVTALAAMLTLLPALLVILGRRVFWPFVPRVRSTVEESETIWARAGRLVRRAPRLVWLGTSLSLAVLALGLLGLDTNLPQTEQFRTTPDSIAGQKLIAESFPAGASAPATVIAAASAAQPVQQAIAGTPGVAAVRPSGQAGGLVSFAATLAAEPSSQAAFDTIERLRERVHAIPGAQALVGGSDASSFDVARANARDRMVVMPLVLAVVLVILGLLLRAIVAPLILIATVVLSFAAALGTSVVVFDWLFGFAGVEGSLPLLSFVFLVALGVDYNIFLMSRVHEEAAQIGTRAGMLRGLGATGGVITSAGLVLAATFAVLSVLPLVLMTELGFIVAFGVLLDTLIVRVILVPAITFDLGRVLWWPSALARRPVEPVASVAGSPRPEPLAGDGY